MLFRQYLQPETGCASYLFGCTGTARAVAVDVLPNAVRPMLDILDLSGMHCVAVVETHLQADHVSAGRDLAARTGAPYVAHHAAPLAFPFAAAHNGDRIDAGNVQVTIWETPGHSDDSLALLVTDRTRADEPWVVLTGDTLLVGDAGRPDLHGEANAAQLASMLYDSLQRLSALPDYVAVYPSHFAGSVCGRALSATPASTIGFERRHNAALAPRTREELIRFMLHDLPEEPPDFARMRLVNRGLPPAATVPTTA
ncbi:MAG: MBL fold metallo-hydrolase [Sphaerobacter sp.]|nr:MBL fold metallo-hydrolase [Sphaerobacter sp.]